MDGFFKEVILPTVAVVILFAAAIFISANMAYRHSCQEKANVMGLRYQYSLWTECMVEIDGKMQPFNQYNTINLNN